VPSALSRDEIRAAVDSVPGWYHTLELPHGVVTPGWFDLRGLVARLPWPQVAGLRCLDVATWDGFFAFELERRGAAEVVATDIASHADWDHLPGTEEFSADFHESVIGEKGRGFEVAARCLGSSVRREMINVYDLSPERVGEFDVVVCGALLLHLRDPFRALAAIRSVCRSVFLSIEQVSVDLTTFLGRTSSMNLKGEYGQWAVPTVVGHRRMLEMAGFTVERTAGPFVEGFGSSHPAERQSISDRVRALWLGGPGVPKAAALCRVR
jgi:tRNA (mo5U34)-methyltransferase